MTLSRLFVLALGVVASLAPCLSCAQENEEQAKANKPEKIKLLFIGNSFTFYNSLNKTVQDMLNVSGVPAVAKRSAPGGWRFRQHFNGETPKDYKDKPTPETIRSQKWDYVVLQEQSSGAVDHRAEFLEFGKKLCDMIRENNPETKILLYQTWQRCPGMFEGYGVNADGETRNAVLASWTKRYGEPSDATIEALQDGMQGGYAKLAELTGATVAPVGQAFFTVGDKYDLYCDEGDKKPFHPNPLGTYLGGCVFFKTITGKSPVGLYQKLTAAGKEYKLTAKEAAYLEEVADKTVADVK